MIKIKNLRQRFAFSPRTRKLLPEEQEKLEEGLREFLRKHLSSCVIENTDTGNTLVVY